MKKSFAKKIKISKRGKILRLAMGIGHNRSKKRRGSLGEKRKNWSVADMNMKLLKNYLRSK